MEMNVKYCNYELNKGLEEVQANLYNQTTLDLKITGKKIQERIEREKMDPKMIRYAFDNDNKLIAFVEARDYAKPGEFIIQRVSAVAECPQEVKTKLFEDLLNYLKSKKMDHNLKYYTNGDSEHLTYAKEHGYELNTKFLRYTIDLESISKFDTSNLIYTIRSAKMEDLEQIFECYNKVHPDLGRSITDQTLSMIKSQIKSGLLFLVYEGEELIGVGGIKAPDRSEGAVPRESLRINPLYNLPKKLYALPILMKHALEISLKEDWNQNILRVSFTDENPEELDLLLKIAMIPPVTRMQWIIS